jgi:GH24 family phage-related lysozyme (muramidase)
MVKALHGMRCARIQRLLPTLRRFVSEPRMTERRMAEAEVCPFFAFRTYRCNPGIASICRGCARKAVSLTEVHCKTARHVDSFKW